MAEPTYNVKGSSSWQQWGWRSPLAWAGSDACAVDFLHRQLGMMRGTAQSCCALHEIHASQVRISVFSCKGSFVNAHSSAKVLCVLFFLAVIFCLSEFTSYS